MPDRRKLARAQVQAAAQLIIDLNSVVECTVRDLTSAGAGIETFDERTAFPHDLALTFDHARTIRHCRLVWQERNRLGIRFVEPGLQTA
jgi:hypothetical protein